jgi:hypothetical protein
MTKSLQIAFFSCLVVFLLSTCHKEEKVEVDNETQSAVDNAIADQEYMAVTPAVNSHAINTKGVGAQSRIAARCDSLTKISGDTLWGMPGHVDPTYTMNISNGGCAFTMPDGRFRNGALSVRLTGKIKVPGSKMIIKMLDYKAAGVKYACDSMVVETLESTGLSIKFHVQLVNGVCTGQNPNNPWTIKYSLNRTITLYPRGTDGLGADPTIMVYGTSSGVNRAGRAFSVNIPASTPLVKKGSCEFISSGVMELTPEGFATRSIDFGYSISPAPYGGCDEDASFTVKGSTVAFKLK